MTEIENRCSICNENCDEIQVSSNGFSINCKNCGRIFIHINHGLNEQNLHIIRGYLYETRDRQKTLDIYPENVEKILTDPLIPKTSIEKLNKLLLAYYKFDGGFNVIFNFADVPPAAGYAVNKSEIDMMLKALVDEGYLEIKHVSAKFGAGPNHTFTLKGLEHCESLLSSNESKTAFVAMKFSEEMKSLHENAIKPACAGCGFSALTVDEKEHNDDITDKIISEIKTSHFIVADFTGNNAGVYYEAGYAKGLGLPVIKTCKKSWFDDPSTDDEGKKINKLHFDIEHDNLILWENEGDLKRKLENRIRATIL